MKLHKVQHEHEVVVEITFPPFFCVHFSGVNAIHTEVLLTASEECFRQKKSNM